jgi:hypothetical protein
MRSVKTKIGRWQIDYNADATRACYAQVAQGSQVTWSCGDCRNFAAALEQAFPPAARDVLDQLGIDYSKAAEVYTTGRGDSGLHQYGGWFHFVGHIAAGADAWRQVEKDGESFAGELERLVDHFELGFTSRIALLSEAFAGKPVVQLEFQTQVPWLIAEPQPA